MRRFSDKIVDILYPRAPGEPDRDPMWLKIGWLVFLVGVLGFGYIASRLP